MNDAFPDYDFGSAKLEQFIQTDLETTMRTINNNLSELMVENNSVLGQLWRGIDETVNIRKSVVFTYKADDEDPLSEGMSYMTLLSTCES
jgi:hypothetical protein